MLKSFQIGLFVDVRCYPALKPYIF